MSEPRDAVAYLFTDIRGLLMQVNREIANFSEMRLPKAALSGSMIPGWQDNSESDLYLEPDQSWMCLDPTSARQRHLVFAHPTDPYTTGAYQKDVRRVAQLTEKFIIGSGIADNIYIGPELEFHALKSVRYSTSSCANFAIIEELDGWENNSLTGGSGHRMGHPSMHFATKPIDQFQELRDDISLALTKVGINVVHHTHESGPSQQEIGVQYKPLTRAADEVQLQKMVVKNLCIKHGLTATFMPKPMAYQPGNGMHVNISLWKDGANIFYGGAPNKLSKTAEHFIGGILLHLKSLNAICNPSTNSYARLRFLYSLMIEAKYGYRNRSTVIRVPHFDSPENCRLEIRFPDPASNPYLAFSAIALAGYEGIIQSIEPSEPVVINPKWYENPLDISAASEKAIARDLFEALHNLSKDSSFLMQGDCFSNDLIKAIIADGSFFCHWNGTTPNPQEFPVHFGA